MNNNLNAELIEKARQAKSPEELLALAKENEITLSEEEAKAYFEKLNKSGELADDELDSVAGGACGSVTPCPENYVYTFSTCPLWACTICCEGIDAHRNNNIQHVKNSDGFYCCDCKYYQFDTKTAWFICTNPNGNFCKPV